MIHEGNGHANCVVEAILNSNNNENEYVNQTDLFEVDHHSRVYYAATLTDVFILGTLGDTEFVRLEKKSQYSKLLEMRIFNERAELKVWRSDIGSKFQIRILDDRTALDSSSSMKNDKTSVPDYFEEVQLLDIDRKESKSANDVRATGGGAYSLPDHVFAMNNPGLIVRHYFDKYEQSGNAYIRDWRCVGFRDVSE